MLPGLLRHPDLHPCSLQTRALDFVSHTEGEAAVWLVGPRKHVRYRVTLEIFSQENRMLARAQQEWDQDAEEDSHTVFMAVPALPAGVYSFDFMAFDAFPGIEEDEAILAIRRLQVQVSDPVTTPSVTCPSTLVWPLESDPSEPEEACRVSSEQRRDAHASSEQRRDAEEQVTLVLAGGIEDCWYLAQAAQSWSGPVSAALYAASLPQLHLLSAWVRATLGPRARARCQALRAVVLPPCQDPSPLSPSSSPSSSSSSGRRCGS